MKTSTNNRYPTRTPLPQAGWVRLAPCLLGLLAAGMSSAVNAATSFPQYPLQTGTGAVPPNIMFILDNSDSMQNISMPDGIIGDNPLPQYEVKPEHIGVRAVAINSIAYNPEKVYLPWIKADGLRYTEGFSSVKRVYRDVLNLKDLGLMRSVDREFFVLKSPTADKLKTENYWRYRINENDERWYRTEYRYDPKSKSYSWSNENQLDPEGVPNQLTNYLTWYSYHRTRMKVAKAGASQAFSDLGTNYRVGYDPILPPIMKDNLRAEGQADWAPLMPIPVETADGLFTGANRAAWFEALQQESSLNGTPLHNALARSGHYYSTAKPWTVDGSGEEIACRRSYAIMTTDGYWNDGKRFNGDRWKPTPANADEGMNYPYQDRYSGTLADVAMHFWKTDLRPSLADDVVPTNEDSAEWQHMSTFTVSIGEQGTLDPKGNYPNEWPDPTRSTGPVRIDDLWHAAVNGRGKFVVATDADAFALALSSALKSIDAQQASGSSVSANGYSISTNTQLFQATYKTGKWIGDVRAYDISSGSLPAAPTWSLATTSMDPAFARRGVFTWNEKKGRGAVLTLAALTSAQVNTLEARAGTPSAVTSDENLAYIKGDSTLEQKSDGTGKLRAREDSLVGDIVNSSPIYQAETKVPSLYVGANDGMLHAMDAESGKPLFSYLPKGVDFTALADLSNPDYEHRFFVDGQIDVTPKAYGEGRNILVSGLGRGGKGIFGLDVSDPAAFNVDNVLFDWTGAADRDMGYVMSTPVVRKGNNGTSVVITANGIESVGGKSGIYIYVLGSDGKITTYYKFMTSVAGGNGMTNFNVADLDSNGTADIVYAGDIKGNMWRLDIRNSSPSRWGYTQVGGVDVPLFQAKDASGNPQPITGGIAMAREPLTGRVFISFGTGKLLLDSDLVRPGMDQQTQTIYSVIDDGNAVMRSELTQRTIPYSGEDELGREARGFEDYSELPADSKGWFIDLGSVPASAYGERIVTAPGIRERRMWFSTIIPTVGEGCGMGGTGYINVLDAFTGTNPGSIDGDTYGYIDVNGDGIRNDYVDGKGYVSGVQLDIGLPGQVIDMGSKYFVGGSNGGLGSGGLLPGGGTAQRVQWRELVNQN